MTSTGFVLAPWHMWGNTINLTSDADQAGGNTSSGQLLKVAYKRPETWSFFFGVELVAAVTPNPNMDIIVLIDVMAGVGRTVFDTKAHGNIFIAPGFARFLFQFTPPLITSVKKYTTVGQGPPLDDSTPLIRSPIDSFPAEDIQVQAQCRISGTPGSSATVSVTGWVAPKSHVRPEWFSSDSDDEDRFRGKESGGT